MSDRKSDVLQSTLDLMVLKTLESMGSLLDRSNARAESGVEGLETITNTSPVRLRCSPHSNDLPTLLRTAVRHWITPPEFASGKYFSSQASLCWRTANRPARFEKE
jgi:hypothetical protein